RFDGLRRPGGRGPAACGGPSEGRGPALQQRDDWRRDTSSPVGREVRGSEMVRERVRVGAEPTWVYPCPARHGGLLLINTGSVDVVVDTREDVIADDPTAGLAVGVGQTVTIP